MKYLTNAAAGDAGEFFFAYRIASVLKWPCRLFDIDIGIDAQVEIIDDSTRESRGKFVAFQIKATSGDQQSYRYVESRQLDYWRELDVPVFVVLVDLNGQEMYLHLVKRDAKYQVTDEGKVRINFDLVNEQFNTESGVIISAAADKDALLHIKKHLEPVRNGVTNIEDAIGRSAEAGNLDELIQCMRERISLHKSLLQAQAISKALRAGDSECQQVAEAFNSALSLLRKHMDSYQMTDHDSSDNEIRNFICE